MVLDQRGVGGHALGRSIATGGGISERPRRTSPLQVRRSRLASVPSYFLPVEDPADDALDARSSARNRSASLGRPSASYSTARSCNAPCM